MYSGTGSLGGGGAKTKCTHLVFALLHKLPQNRTIDIKKKLCVNVYKWGTGWKYEINYPV